MDSYILMVIIVLAIGGVFGYTTKRNIDKHRKDKKILSKKQKRELENKKK